MGIWFRRVMALGLMSLGLALIFLPYNETRSGSVEKEVITLIIEKVLVPNDIHGRFPESTIVDVTGPELNPNDYPDLWRAFINLDENWTHDSAVLDEWNRFQESVLKGGRSFRLLVFRDALIACSIGKEQKETGNGTSESESTNTEPDKAIFEYLGRYNPNIKTLSESDLSDYPSIIAAAKQLQNKGMPKDYSLRPPMSNQEWDRMRDRYLKPVVDLQTFHFNGMYFGPQFGIDVTYKKGRIPGLRTALMVLGVIAMAMGGLFLKTLYVKKHGIMVNPRRVAILFDVIVLMFTIPSAYMLINTVLEKLLYVKPITDEDFIVFMGVYFFIAGMPLATLYTSRFTSQSVDINPDGICIDSMFGKGFIPWEALVSVDVENEYVPVNRVEVTIPRQLQKILTLRDSSGRRLTVNEPQLKSVKQKIIQKFNENMPDHLREKTFEILNQW